MAQQLFISDGTAAGSHSLATFSIDGLGNDSSPSGFTGLNGKVLFGANDGIHGFELWASDASTHETHMLLDLNPGAGQGAGSPPIAIALWQFFSGNDWRSRLSAMGYRRNRKLERHCSPMPRLNLTPPMWRC